jgi:transcriptional antiterminator NusG
MESEDSDNLDSEDRDDDVEDRLGDEADGDAVEEAPAAAEPVAAEPAAESNKTWFVLKVQSNREDSIRDAIMKRIKIAGLEEFIEDIVVPTEKVTEIKSGKKRVMERKFYPGYIMVKLELNDDVWFVIRETPGVGDFVGAGGKPVAMTEQDVAKMLGREKEVELTAPRLKINFNKGDRVKIKEGTFENFEGEVDEVIEAKGLVRVMIQIFGRPTPVELEYWQVEPV